MGIQAREQTASMNTAVTGAALSNVATIIQLAAMVFLIAPEALPRLTWPLALSGFCTVAYGLIFYAISKEIGMKENLKIQQRHAFNLKAVLGFTGLLTCILLVSAALHAWLGSQAVLPMAAIAGLADAHAGALAALSLVTSQKITPEQAVWPVLMSLTTNAVSKAMVAYQSGGLHFLARVAPSLLCFVVAAWLGAWLN
jgi:hypothetical protein